MLAGYPDLTIEQAAAKVLPKVKGAFSLIFMDENTLYAARDPQGIRPLVLGRLERGWVIASETAALDIVGASFVREVEPGEIVAIDDDGLRSTKFAEPDPKGCLFEFVYLARPDTRSPASAIHSTRVEIGRRLAGAPGDADLVIAARSPARPARSGTPRSPASPTARAWSRTRTSAARSSSRARRSASSASG
jgi:amidophosphoribosyltransferase